MRPINRKTYNHLKLIAKQNSELKASNVNSVDEKTFLINLQKELKLRNERDKYKDETIHRLTKKIDNLERGKEDEIKISLIKNIIVLHDSIEKFQKKFEYIQDDKLQKDIEFLKDEITDELLFNNDVEPIESAIGDDFNRDIHIAKETFPIELVEKDKTIYSIVKKGFRYKNKVIRKQEVIKCKLESRNQI